MKELNFLELIDSIRNYINVGNVLNCFDSHNSIIEEQKLNFSWILLILSSFFCIFVIFSSIRTGKHLKLSPFSISKKYIFICIIRTGPSKFRSSYLGDSMNWTSASFSRWLDLVSERQYMYITVLIVLLSLTKYNFMLLSEKSCI